MNLRSLIQPLEILLVELTGTHNVFHTKIEELAFDELMLLLDISMN